MFISIPDRLLSKIFLATLRRRSSFRIAQIEMWGGFCHNLSLIIVPKKSILLTLIAIYSPFEFSIGDTRSLKSNPKVVKVFLSNSFTFSPFIHFLYCFRTLLLSYSRKETTPWCRSVPDGPMRSNVQEGNDFPQALGSRIKLL